jgi:hypothetical protein
MDPYFHFALAMNVCTEGVEKVLRTSLWTRLTVVEAKVVWAGICHDVRTQLKIVQGTLNAVAYRYDILDLIVLPFLQQHLHMKYISLRW